jgi:hypothetical protein
MNDWYVSRVAGGGAGDIVRRTAEGEARARANRVKARLRAETPGPLI